MPKAEIAPAIFQVEKRQETNIWRFKHHFGLHFTMNSATKTWYDDIIDLNRNIQAYKTIDFFDRFYFLSFELRQLFCSYTWVEVDLRPSWGKSEAIQFFYHVPPLLCV